LHTNQFAPLNSNYSARYKPCPSSWFSLSASGALSNYGKSAGGAVNIHLPGFNLYAGVDSYLPLLNVTPQYIPIDSFNTNVTLGLAITFGKANGRYWN
jgi:hypothetical protein